MTGTYEMADLYSATSDDILVKEAAVMGNTEAFAELYRRRFPMVVGYLRRRAFDGEPVEDLAQEAFTIALERLEQYDPSTGMAVGQWLCGFAGIALKQERWARSAYWRARNAAINDQIRELRDGIAPWLDEDGTDPGRPIEITDDVCAAIKQLRPHYRQAIELHYIDGLTIYETAKAMGVSTTAVPRYLTAGVDEIRNPDKAKRLATPATYDPDATRARLIEKAREVIAEVGLENATAKEIARRAGHYNSIVCKHFGTVKRLLAVAQGLEDAPPPRATSDLPARILRAAREVIAEVGTENVTLKTITQRAGCSRQPIYNHFGNVEGLLAAAVAA